MRENTSRSGATQRNAALTAILLLCCTVHAQSGSYPSKPIRFIVGAAPGGTTSAAFLRRIWVLGDVTRFLAAHLRPTHNPALPSPGATTDSLK